MKSNDNIQKQQMTQGLLLERAGSQAGPGGDDPLSQTTFIQQLNTSGGSAPATGCDLLKDLAKRLCHIRPTTSSARGIGATPIPPSGPSSCILQDKPTIRRGAQRTMQEEGRRDSFTDGASAFGRTIREF